MNQLKIIVGRDYIQNVFTKSDAENLLHSLKERIEEARGLEDHQSIIDDCKRILNISSNYPELRIAEFIFYRKIAKAYEKLGDNTKALLFFKNSLKAAKELEKKEPVDFSKEILALENKIKNL